MKLQICGKCGGPRRKLNTALCAICRRNTPEGREKKKARYVKWYQSQHARAMQLQRKYRLKFHEQRLADSRKWHKAHAERSHALSLRSARKWQLGHPEEYKEHQRLYRERHPEKLQVSAQRRRALARNLPCTLTDSQWAAICAAYKFRCAYCGKKVKLTQDHVLPLSKGGGTVAENIVPACKSCNSRKSARLPSKPVKLVLAL